VKLNNTSAIISYHVHHFEFAQGCKTLVRHCGTTLATEVTMQRRVETIWIPVVPHKAVAEVSKIGKL
jgi:hypothetical protein